VHQLAGGDPEEDHNDAADNDDELFIILAHAEAKFSMMISRLVWIWSLL